jgi:HEPN domain-containing protein
MSDESEDRSWLFKHSTDEWLTRALRELERADAAFQQRNAAAAHAGLKRAAGMALNAALIEEPNPAWGRTYVEHVRALTGEERAPASVREAATKLVELPVAASGVVTLRTPSQERELVEAARTVMSYAYAIAHRLASK